MDILDRVPLFLFLHALNAFSVACQVLKTVLNLLVVESYFTFVVGVIGEIGVGAELDGCWIWQVNIDNLLQPLRKLSLKQ